MSPSQPRFRSDLVARPLRVGASRCIEIFDPARGESMRFSPLGYAVAYLMDGRRDLPALATRIAADLSITLPIARLEDLVERLDRLGCLAGTENACTVAMPRDQLVALRATASGEPSATRADPRDGDASASVRLDDLVTQLWKAPTGNAPIMPLRPPRRLQAPPPIPPPARAARATPLARPAQRPVAVELPGLPARLPPAARPPAPAPAPAPSASAARPPARRAPAPPRAAAEPALRPSSRPRNRSRNRGPVRPARVAREWPATTTPAGGDLDLVPVLPRAERAHPRSRLQQRGYATSVHRDDSTLPPWWALAMLASASAWASWSLLRLL